MKNLPQNNASSMDMHLSNVSKNITWSSLFDEITITDDIAM